MMNSAAGGRWCRVVTVLAIALVTVVVLAVPAFAHPVFSNGPPGFPNPMGGTGGPGQTPPYPAGSRPTLNLFLPFEQEGVVYKGAENTTVGVRVTLPQAWTSPACGVVRTSPPVGYQQLGTEVPGWSCTVETVSGHQVLHWSGPQISASQTHDDSAQFFTFQATMPSPTATISYGAKGGPEGIHVTQVYADGTTEPWIPPNDPAAVSDPGHVANGVVRTVASTTAPAPTSASAPRPTRAPTQGGTTQGGTAQGGTTQAGKTQGGTTQGGTTQGGATASSSPPPEQGGGGAVSPPPGGAPPAGSTTSAGPSSTDMPGSPGVTPAEPSPGAESPPPSVEALTQQRDNASTQGLGWGVWAGIALGALLLAGALIVVIQRRRRVS